MGELKLSSKIITEGMCFANLEGAIDAHTAPALESELVNIISTGKIGRLILDMKKVSFISSAGMGVLMLIRKQLEQAGGGVVVSNIPQEIREVFNVLGFNNFFDFVSGEEEAIAYFSKGAVAAAAPAPAQRAEFPLVVQCPSCGVKLKVPKPAKFKCKTCEGIFFIKEDGTAEKA